MTQYHFNILEENLQAQILREESIFIAEREDKNHRILLYQINSFYVEEYHHKHFNIITKFHSFRSMKQLDPYLKEIDISDLTEA